MVVTKDRDVSVYFKGHSQLFILKTLTQCEVQYGLKNMLQSILMFKEKKGLI